MNIAQATRILHNLGNVGRSPEDLLRMMPTDEQLQTAVDVAKRRIDAAAYVVKSHFKPNPVKSIGFLTDAEKDRLGETVRKADASLDQILDKLNQLMVQKYQGIPNGEEVFISIPGGVCKEGFLLESTDTGGFCVVRTFNRDGEEEIRRARFSNTEPQEKNLFSNICWLKSLKPDNNIATIPS